jgi:prepilin-type N-terminal cleavage/methylation domain-containing protein
MKRHWPWRRGTGAGADGNRRTPCDGFTLVELLVALMIATIALVALAFTLAAALKVAGLQKTRSQANEIATQAIEDLQRLDYDHLGVCSPAPGTAPTGLTAPVFLANCSSPTYAEPCTPTVGQVPATSYTCTRIGIGYQVRRYIAWGDSTHTNKRLAVYVDWTDQAGAHQVAQQSSLRSPGQGSVIGLPLPSFGTTSVLVGGSTASTSNPVKLVNGVVQSTITFQATAGGLPDSVFVNFLNLGPDGPEGSSLELTASGGGAWSATIPAGSSQFNFGSGTQYVTFVAVRSADGKVNSQPSAQVVTFVACQAGGVNCSASPNPPSLSNVTVSPTAPRIDPAGLLCADITIGATTTNLTAADTVTASFQTLNGPYTVSLTSSNGSAWAGVIPVAARYRFPSGSQAVYVTAAQAYAPSGSPPQYGSTATVASSPLTFGGGCP